MRICPSCASRFSSSGWTCPACGHDASGAGYAQIASDGDVESFPEEAFATLVELEGRSAWFRSRNALIVWALRRHFPAARSFLEVGCGTGVVLEALARAFPGLELTGTDLSARGLEAVAARGLPVSLVRADATELPFDAEFDVTGAFDVLEHIGDDALVLEQARQATKPDGGLVLTVPQHPSLWSRLDDYAGHRRRYRRAELLEKVSAAGFDPIRVTSFVSLLLPALAVRRRLERRARGEFDLRREFPSSRVLDATLGASLRAERTLIAAGASLPAGASLLVVARRR